MEEASPLTGKKSKKAASGMDGRRRWSSVASAIMVALIMTVPPILLVLTGRLDAPAVWVKSTVAAGLQAKRESKKDVPQGSLLPPGFDEQSCPSRYRKNMTRSPTPYLIERLRGQEALQRRCGPGNEPYTRASERLKSGQKYVDTVDGCGHLVLLSYRGLGNRILAMASAFLYAKLTNRVLLVDRGASLPDLFCEPSPGATWLLPLDFPLQGYKDLGESAAESYGNVMLHNSTWPASENRFVYLHLEGGATPANRLLYCDDHRQFLHREELHRLFPRKDSVFYIISRYLLHPTNHVWGMVTRFYDSYLKDADETLGIQIRVFDYDMPPQNVLDQILACTSREHLLPGVVPLAEMYLLSMTDKIVTSGWSTFGYVGAALGGLTPYIMMRPVHLVVPDRAMSMEPCALGRAYFECTRKEYDRVFHTDNRVPHVKACEDVAWGLKLTEPITDKQGGVDT
ncbi:unnamed protein product [Alopecurus aequalis]